MLNPVEGRSKYFEMFILGFLYEKVFFLQEMRRQKGGISITFDIFIPKILKLLRLQ